MKLRKLSWPWQSPNRKTPHPAPPAKPLSDLEDKNAPDTLRIEHSAGMGAEDAVIQPGEEEKTVDAADTPEPALMAEASLRPCPAAKADTGVRRKQEEGERVAWIAKQKKKKSGKGIK